MDAGYLHVIAFRGAAVPVPVSLCRSGRRNFLCRSPSSSQKPQATLRCRDFGERDPRGEFHGTGDRSRPQAGRQKAARRHTEPAASGQPATVGRPGRERSRPGQRACHRDRSMAGHSRRRRRFRCRFRAARNPVRSTASGPGARSKSTAVSFGSETTAAPTTTGGTRSKTPSARSGSSTASPRAKTAASRARRRRRRRAPTGHRSSPGGPGCHGRQHLQPAPANHRHAPRTPDAQPRLPSRQIPGPEAKSVSPRLRGQRPAASHPRPPPATATPRAARTRGQRLHAAAVAASAATHDRAQRRFRRSGCSAARQPRGRRAAAPEPRPAATRRCRRLAGTASNAARVVPAPPGSGTPSDEAAAAEPDAQADDAEGGCCLPAARRREASPAAVRPVAPPASAPVEEPADPTEATDWYQPTVASTMPYEFPSTGSVRLIPAPSQALAPSCRLRPAAPGHRGRARPAPSTHGHLARAIRDRPRRGFTCAAATGRARDHRQSPG